MAKVRISAFARRSSFKQEKQMEKSWKPGKYPYRKKCIKMTYKTFASVRTASRWRKKGGGTLRATASQCSDSQSAQHTTPHHLPIAVSAQAQSLAHRIRSHSGTVSFGRPYKCCSLTARWRDVFKPAGMSCCVELSVCWLLVGCKLLVHWEKSGQQVSPVITWLIIWKTWFPN